MSLSFGFNLRAQPLILRISSFSSRKQPPSGPVSFSIIVNFVILVSWLWASCLFASPPTETPFHFLPSAGVGITISKPPTPLRGPSDHEEDEGHLVAWQAPHDPGVVYISNSSLHPPPPSWSRELNVSLYSHCIFSVGWVVSQSVNQVSRRSKRELHLGERVRIGLPRITNSGSSSWFQSSTLWSRDFQDILFRTLWMVYGV